MKPIYQILNDYWGYTSFKPMQEEIITSVMNGKDSVALLPTGGGKSLCFQVPTMAMDGICIVVSPLVALMSDQVEGLKSRRIKAIKLVGGISFEDLNILLNNALYGNYKFLYLSPERLQQEIVQNYIKQMNVNLIAIDEAHCISQWGNDFRPAYKNIHILRELQPLVPFLALTATATPEVLEDTIAQLKLELPSVFKSSFVRKNLSYQVFKEDDKLYHTEKLLKNNTGSAIVYVRSRSQTVEISSQLNSLGITATFYHGGVSSKDKNERLEQWRSERISTMVATNAFGMGIDHPNVRYVIHIQIPESLESYFQEAGRAGRDGNYSQAVLFYNDFDITYVKKQFIDSLPDPPYLKKIYRALNNYFQISYGEGEFSLHNLNFTEFCSVNNLNTVLAFNALNSLDRLGIIQLTQEFGRKSDIKFLIPSERLIEYFKGDPRISIIGKTILRLYGGVFEIPIAINLDLIVSKTGQSIDLIIESLKKMEKDGVLDLHLRVTDASLTFLVPREDDRTINVVSRDVKALNAKKTAMVHSVLSYIDNDKVCRSMQLVSYFGEKHTEPCGICSVCTSKITSLKNKEAILISKDILQFLEEREMNSREICEKLIFAESKILKTLQLLLDAKKIGIDLKNRYHLV